jgi:hypothetical protein
MAWMVGVTGKCQKSRELPGLALRLAGTAVEGLPGLGAAEQGRMVAYGSGWLASARDGRNAQAILGSPRQSRGPRNSCGHGAGLRWPVARPLGHAAPLALSCSASMPAMSAATSGSMLGRSRISK